ncbi:TlpA family protein disulfide reductase [Pedobacter sp. MC2016-14]|uniref:TlpA family protein disulfide reductase n=1 Tax=Pedobacter sp. MC2016-14 TaxID=2897327 RepID=UPI001E570E47|nr:TlpA disulfide reductase family protein [Pedobacter sp. MC2016-14]MCD0490565.1 TlpA family protein disulfide reductase [Pedobacter sp. MC2016-14]
MRKSHIIIATFLMSIIASKLHAQTNTIKLTGLIDTSFMRMYQCKELTIKIKETANEKGEGGEVFKAKVSPDGRFNTQINSKDSLVYLSFEFQDNVGSGGWKGYYFNITKMQVSTGLSELYLFQVGDSINIDFRENGYILFSGKGSEKLNCQWQVYNTKTIQNSISIRTLDLEHAGHLEQATLLENKAVNMQVALRLMIIKSYQDKLSERVYKLLNLDAIASAQHNIYHKLPFYLWIYKEKQDSVIVRNYYSSILKTDYPSNIDSVTLAQSGYYANAMLKKEIARSMLYEDSKRSLKHLSFNVLYNRMKDNYTGLLRDKLIYLCYETLITKFSDESKFYLKDALETINSAKYKLLLSKLADRQYMAYPFEFYDANDKVHRLSDYKGKLLIIDFWFTGCVPCQMLAKAMHPIYEKYKSNSDIVFLTVSTDKKPLWMESVKSGLYTAKGMTNLHTKGQGFANPLIVNYKFNGFPRQLIISKNGELITSSPPRVDVGKMHVQAFEKIIEENLAK